MRTIMILNPKGGCGKSTLSTNLASFYAAEGKVVMLADFDPQQSAMEWLAARDEKYTEIVGIDASDGLRVPKSIEVLIMDVPAGIRGRDLSNAMRRAQTIIIPVLPSPIDIRAAAHFIRDLLTSGKVSRKEVKLAVVANRVKENTNIFHTLERFLDRLSIPFITSLRDTQNYIKAADRGVGIFEMGPAAVEKDLEQWQPLLKWLKSKRSQP